MSPTFRPPPILNEQFIMDRIEPELNTGCWLWTARMSRRKGSYGRVSRGTRLSCLPAHRVSFEVFNGPIPDGLIVRHKCDTPACVNPNHLEVGTHADNVADMVKRGRARGAAPGCVPYNRVIPEETVRLIAAEAQDGKPWRVIALELGQPYDVVYRIAAGRAWVNVTGLTRLKRAPKNAKMAPKVYYATQRMRA